MCNVIVTQGKLFLKFFVVFESKLAMGTLRTMYCVRKYLCAPATSTQAERVFSALGWMLKKRRQALTGAHVNSQLFLKENLEW